MSTPIFGGFFGDFTGPGRACIPNQVGAHRAALLEIFPPLPEGHAAVFVAGVILAGVKHIVFPVAHRADEGDGGLYGNAKREIPAAGAGIAPGGLLRRRFGLRRGRGDRPALPRLGEEKGLAPLSHRPPAPSAHTWAAWTPPAHRTCRTARAAQGRAGRRPAGRRSTAAYRSRSRGGSPGTAPGTPRPAGGRT